MMFDFNSGALDLDYTLEYIEGHSQITRQLPYKGLTAGTPLKKHIVALANFNGEAGDSNNGVTFNLPAGGIKSYDDIKNISVTMKGVIPKNAMHPMAARDNNGIEITMGNNNIELNLERVISRFGFTNVTKSETDKVTGAVTPAKQVFTATRIEMANHATTYYPFDDTKAPTLSATPIAIDLDNTENTAFYMLPTPRNMTEGQGLNVKVFGKTNGSSTVNFSKVLQIAQEPIGSFNGSVVRNCAYAMYVEFNRNLILDGQPKPEDSADVEGASFMNTDMYAPDAE